MSSENTNDDAVDADDADAEPPTLTDGDRGPRDRIEEEADRAVEQFDQGIVDLLSWILDTETRARIYVYLRQNPASVSEEIAEGTGLYPSTVREALAELHEEEKVERHKRESEGAGNNPYEYTAIAPSDLVGGVAGQVQAELNAVFNLDRYLGADDPDHVPAGDDPVTITVDDATDDEDDRSTGEDDRPTGEAGDEGDSDDDDAMDDGTNDGTDDAMDDETA